MNAKPLFVIGLIVLTILACNFSAPTPTTAPIASPTQEPTIAPPQTPLPFYQTVTLETLLYQEQGKAPDFTLKAETPVLRGSNDPRIDKINAALAAVVQQDIKSFTKDTATLPAVPISAGSSFDLHYALISPPGNVLSLQLQIEGYSDGAAHPYHITTSYTFDLEKGQPISLEQLFAPGANFLQVISEYCKAELSKRDIAFDMFSSGADPTPENYSVWNLSPDGVLIYFNEYQVAPYAAGPQKVVIPFAALKDLTNPQGPLNKSQP